MPSVNYTKIADRNVSFGLIRTNPKLTSNLKISIDSTSNLWMNSIDANEQLASQKYKRIPISPTSNHEANVCKFYDNGRTPSKISFGVGTSIRTDVMARDLKDQYDFDLYTGGAKYLSSQYPEKFSYFAPLYLDQIIPEYFVILKIPGASNYSAAKWYQKIQDPTFTQAQFAEDLFKNAQVIKSFSLKANSNIGIYLRNIRNNPMYSDNPLYVNFKENGYSFYRGISISSGTYVEIPEMLSTTLRQATGQLKLEKYIVGGFERNNMVHPKLLNLEFLFSDDTSSDYSINRYLGFYCNAIDLAKFDIDLIGMYENEMDNTIPLPRIYSKYEDVSLNIANPTGVVIRGESVTDDLSFMQTALTDPNSLFFPYLKTKNDDLHFIKTSNGADFEQVHTNIKFKIDDTRFNIGKAFGPYSLFSQETGQEVIQDTRSTVLLKIETIPNHLDALRIYHQNGSTFDPLDSNGSYDDLVFVKNYFNGSKTYSIDYPEISKIEFRIPVDPNLSAAAFIPNLPQVENIQYVSIENGSLWEWTGSAYIESTVVSPVGDPVQFYMDETNDPNQFDQVFSPIIQANSTSTVNMEEASLDFVVDDLVPFEIGNTVKIRPDSYRYMIGEITAIDEGLSQITVQVSEIKGLGEYSNWIVQRHDLGVQYVSQFDGSLWGSTGRSFKRGAIGSRIYVKADGPNISTQTEIVQEIISELMNTDLVTSRFENNLFIQSRPFGDTYGSLALLNKSGSGSFLINGKATKNLVWADGGMIGNQVIIPAGNIEKLSPLTEDIVVKTYQNWSKLSRVCHSAAFVNNDRGITDNTVIKNYLKNATLMTTEAERVLVDYDKIEFRDLFRPSLGVLSIFEIKDFDFDTYSTAYSKFPELDLYQYYYIPPDVNILDFDNYSYRLSGNGSIEVNGITYSTGDTNLVWQQRPGLNSYRVTAGDPIVTISEYVPGKFKNFFENIRATTAGNDSIPIALGEFFPLFGPDSQQALLADLIAKQNEFGTYSSIYDSPAVVINLDTIQVDDPIYLTLAPGLSYEVDQTIRIYSTLDKYVDCTVYSYNSITGETELAITDWTGEGNLSSSNAFVIHMDNPAGFRTYQMYKDGNPSLYLEVRVELIHIDSISNPVQGKVVITGIVGSIIGTQVVNGPWVLGEFAYTETCFRSDIGVQDEDGNLLDFTGFFGLGADHSAPTRRSVAYQYRDRYRTNSLNSEYQIYLENYSKEFSTDNRLVPYISKWGIIDSTDSRGNPYRLNTDIAFGKDNFGPSHREVFPTAEKLTHEWFYIESAFNYEFDPELLRKNYYYFNEAFSASELISNPSYFEKYFTYVPTFNGTEIDRPQYRYSKLRKNEFTNQYETVFNGAKFIFSELNERGDILPITNRFVDYNFSILLKPVREDLRNPQKPLNYRIIENTDAKSILVLIEVAISGKDRVAKDLLFNSDNIYLPGLKFNQSNLFKQLNFLGSTPIKVKVNVIYTTAAGPAGDTEFFKFLLDNTAVDDLTALTGVAIDAETGIVIDNYQLSDGDTVLVKRNGTPSDQLIFAMPGTEIAKLTTAGKIIDICTDTTGITAYTVTQKKRFVIGSSTYLPVRIFSSDNGELTILPVNELNILEVKEVIPTWKSIFGDFRLSFNEKEISNLTYAFLYSVRDKKFNKVKSSFSTVKLAKGISLSLNGLVVSDSSISLDAKTLAGLPENAYTLDQFINPLSGSSNRGGPFAPIMLINRRGISTLVASSSINFSSYSPAKIVDDLSNPRLLNHGILLVNPGELVVGPNKPEVTTLSTVRAADNSTVNPATLDYTGQEITVYFLQGKINYAEAYEVDDLVKIVNSQQIETPNYLLARISEKNVNGSAFVIKAVVYYQNIINPTTTTTTASPTTTTTTTSSGPTTTLAPLPSNWKIVRLPESISALSLSITSVGSTTSLKLDSARVPVLGTVESDWLESTQQFQLFGGKGYFTKLFENLSFANFIKFLDGELEIMSWETYTNGQRVLRPNTNNKLFSIEVEQADQVKKTKQVQPVEQVVETGSRIQVGGYEQIEKDSPEYEVFRYSGEYEVLFKPVSGFKVNTQFNDFVLERSNVRLNTKVSNFFVMPELSYVKYSDRTILDLESANKFKAEYPLIGESPIDHSQFNTLSSSWDFNYHYKYSTKINKTAIPGSNRIAEDYSFVSKLLNLPISFTIEPTSFNLVTNAEFELNETKFIELDKAFVYSIYPTNIRFKINLSKLLASYLIENGIGSQFNQFFQDENGNPISGDANLIGNLTLDQYKIKYCETNLNRLFTVDSVEFFSTPNYGLTDTGATFTQISYSQLGALGYSPIKNIQINNSRSEILTGAVQRIPNAGQSLVPKLKIKYV